MKPLIVTGVSGTQYKYFPLDINADWFEVPANYMFGRLDVGGWFVAYIGQCNNARDRLPCHERWAEAVKQHGVTYVLSHGASADENVRLQEERDLIQALAPPMNVQGQNAFRRGLFG